MLPSYLVVIAYSALLYGAVCYIKFVWLMMCRQMYKSTQVTVDFNGQLPYNSRLAARYVFARQHCCHYRRAWFQLSFTHVPPFCPFSIIREWHAAKMAAVGSAHFRLQKRSSETYEWRHGHYVHVFYSLWKWHTRETVKMHVSAGILVNTVAYGLGEGKLLRK